MDVRELQIHVRVWRLPERCFERVDVRRAVLEPDQGEIEIAGGRRDDIIAVSIDQPFRDEGPTRCRARNALEKAGDRCDPNDADWNFLSFRGEWIAQNDR